jgi:hypothetical protein
MPVSGDTAWERPRRTHPSTRTSCSSRNGTDAPARRRRRSARATGRSPGVGLSETDRPPGRFAGSVTKPRTASGAAAGRATAGTADDGQTRCRRRVAQIRAGHAQAAVESGTDRAPKLHRDRNEIDLPRATSRAARTGIQSLSANVSAAQILSRILCVPCRGHTVDLQNRSVISRRLRVEALFRMR